MRVREAEEELGEGVAGEEVGEELHGVGAEGGDVAVGGGWGVGCWGGGRWGGGAGGGGGWEEVLLAEGGDAAGYVVEDLGADFEAWEWGLG